MTTSLPRCSLMRNVNRSPSMSSIRLCSRAFSQHFVVNQDVVTRIPQPAFGALRHENLAHETLEVRQRQATRLCRLPVRSWSA